ncbi:MAG: DUF4386 domain-containing protein [Bacteroidia bacterium]|nr:DUF4386 domain-containing protein [Bacteroidia bacterium]
MHSDTYTFSPRPATIRQAALTAGIFSLLMFVAAMVAEFFMRQRLIVPDNARETAANILAEPVLFRGGILAYLLVLICDVLLAWALYIFLYRVHPALSLLSACFRLVYTALFGMALSGLLKGFRRLQDPETALAYFNGFEDDWAIALIFFALHLLLTGYLVYRSNIIPKWIGILLVLAGVAYFTDNICKLMLPDHSVYKNVLTLLVAVPSICGELGLALWMLFRGTRVTND